MNAKKESDKLQDYFSLSRKIEDKKHEFENRVSELMLEKVQTEVVIEELIFKINSLKSDLVQLTPLKDHLSTEVCNLKDENKILKKTIKDKKNKHKRFDTKVESLQNDITQLENSLQCHSFKEKTIQENIITISKEYDAILLAKNHEMEHIDKIKKEHHRLLKEINFLSTQKTEILDDILHKKKEQVQNTEKIRDIKNKMGKDFLKAQQFEQEIMLLETRREAIKQTVKEKEQLLEEIVYENQEKLEEINYLLTKYKKTHAKYSTERELYNYYIKYNNKSSFLLLSKLDKLHNIQYDLKKHKKRLTILRTNHLKKQKKVNILQAEEKDLENNLSYLQVSKKTLEGEIASLNDMVFKGKNNFSIIENQNKHYLEETTELSQKIEKIKSQTIALKQEETTLRENKNIINKDYINLKEKVEQLTTSKDNLKKEIKGSLKDQKTILKQIEKGKHELSKHDDKIKLVANKKKSELGDLALLEKEISTLSKNRSGLQEEISALRAHKKKLKKDLHDSKMKDVSLIADKIEPLIKSQLQNIWNTRDNYGTLSQIKVQIHEEILNFFSSTQEKQTILDTVIKYIKSFTFWIKTGGAVAVIAIAILYPVYYKGFSLKTERKISNIKSNNIVHFKESISDTILLNQNFLELIKNKHFEKKWNYSLGEFLENEIGLLTNSSNQIITLQNSLIGVLTPISKRLNNNNYDNIKGLMLSHEIRYNEALKKILGGHQNLINYKKFQKLFYTSYSGQY